jgi:hypothetical protein
MHAGAQRRHTGRGGIIQSTDAVLLIDAVAGTWNQTHAETLFSSEICSAESAADSLTGLGCFYDTQNQTPINESAAGGGALRKY